MDIVYAPYKDPNFESLIERIHPPRICIDNEACRDCTLVKVDSQNKHGILLEMVQVLTDLDFVISKSYVSSDGGWLMDVFHVTDQSGNKVTDESIILYIQQALCASRRETSLEKQVQRKHVTTDLVHTALELTSTNRPGLMSEISAVLADLGCYVYAAAAWTHKGRAACIMYVEDEQEGGPITDGTRLAHIGEQLENVVEAHHGQGERRSVRLTAPAPSRTHTERRLHQLMFADMDYEQCRGCCGGEVVEEGSGWRCRMRGIQECLGTHVSIENCKDKGYSVVNVRSRDRPKLLFDTVCTLMDLQYVVFHAAVSSRGSIAFQEYYIRYKDGCTMDTASEKRKVTQCLIAAVERRTSYGLRFDVLTENRRGLLSDITRVLRENGLSITSAEIGVKGEKACGSFYVTDASGQDVNPKTIELVRKEVGGTVRVVNKSSHWSSDAHLSSDKASSHSGLEKRPRFSLGNLLWAQLERLSTNFSSIRS